MNVPISLSYHAGGTKVEEIASNVGIGWALNAGGMVGRQVRGEPDELGGWVQLNPNNRLAPTMGLQVAHDIEDRTRDGEADIFSYNFGGKSGKFFFDEAGVVHGYPANGVSVVSIDGPTSLMEGLKITTEDGTVYKFTKAERVSQDDRGEVITAWYLSKITSADGTNEINFTYEDVTILSTLSYGETKYFLVGVEGPERHSGLSDLPNTYSMSVTSTHNLTRIDFAGGYVKFNYYNWRADSFIEGFEKSLDQIEVYNDKGQQIKSFDLAHSYFGDGSPQRMEKRLKLVSVTEKSGTITNPPHLFTYNENVQGLHRGSLSRDYWGYYNGKPNSSLLPTFMSPDHTGVLRTFVSSANRGVDTTYAKAFILTKIQYPTGGETEFTYESNRVSDSRLEGITTHTVSYSLSANATYGSLTSPYQTEEFTVPYPSAQVEYILDGLEQSAQQGGCGNFSAYFIKNGVPLPGTLIDHPIATSAVLEGGTYRMGINFYDCLPSRSLNLTFNIGVRVPDAPSGADFAGGLRLKQMTDRPGNGGQAIVKKYRYESEFSPTLSSGSLVNFPPYGYILHADDYENTSGMPTCDNRTWTERLHYVVAQANTNYPLATSQGSYVVYSDVIEDLGINGEIRHKFEIVNHVQSPFPFPPVETFDWRSGMELATKYIARKGTLMVLSKTVDYKYSTIDKGSVLGYKLGEPLVNVGGCPLPKAFLPIVAMYPVMSQFYAVSSIKERLYDINNNTKYTETTTNFAYDPNHLQVVKTGKSSSYGSSNGADVIDEVVTQRKYPQDYTFTGTASGPEASGIKKLQDLHVINVPVEEFVYRQQRNTADAVPAPTNQRVIGSTITTFKSDKPYPDKLYRMEAAAAVPLATFGPGSSLSSNAFIKNANATLASAFVPALSLPVYDDKGNIQQQQKPGGPPSSYIWGYNKQYPIAQVTNASVNDVFVENFEEGAGNSAFGDAKTGNYSSTSGISKLLTSLDPGSYVLSYWSKATTTWVFNSVPVIVSGTNYTINLSGHIDDIRFHPKGAQMTTYTYAPLIGQTSLTDTRNDITYFKHDASGRLKTVKDRDGFIVKAYCYNYQGQLTDCSVPEPAPPPTIYARIEGNNHVPGAGGNPTTEYWSYVSEVLSIRFYADAACTIPYVLTSAMAVKVTDDYSILHDILGYTENGQSVSMHTVPSGVSSFALPTTTGTHTLEAHHHFIEYDDYWDDFYFYDYQVASNSGSNYAVLPTHHYY